MLMEKEFRLAFINGATTFSLMTLSPMTPNGIQHHNIYRGYPAFCVVVLLLHFQCYAERCIFTVILSVIMLNVIMLNVIMLNVIMLNVIMLNVIMLNVIKLNVIMLIAIAPFQMASDKIQISSK
jgi:hypothetical protein